MLLALVRKDIRLMLSVVMMALITLPLSFAVTAGISFATRDSAFSGVSTLAVWASIFSISCQLIFMLAYFSTAFMAGAIISIERQDRSAEFLACLPPLRRHTLASKAIVVAAFVLALLAVYAAFYAASESLNEAAGSRASTRGSLPIVDAFRLLVGCGGLSWAMSSLSKSSTIPVLVGLISPIMVMPLVQILLHVLGVSMQMEATASFVLNGVLLVGVAGFVFGSAWYLLGPVGQI